MHLCACGALLEFGLELLGDWRHLTFLHLMEEWRGNTHAWFDTGTFSLCFFWLVQRQVLSWSNQNVPTPNEVRWKMAWYLWRHYQWIEFVYPHAKRPSDRTKFDMGNINWWLVAPQHHGINRTPRCWSEAKTWWHCQQRRCRSGSIQKFPAAPDNFFDKKETVNLMEPAAVKPEADIYTSDAYD